MSDIPKAGDFAVSFAPARHEAPGDAVEDIAFAAAVLVPLPGVVLAVQPLPIEQPPSGQEANRRSPLREAFLFQAVGRYHDGQVVVVAPLDLVEHAPGEGSHATLAAPPRRQGRLDPRATSSRPGVAMLGWVGPR